MSGWSLSVDDDVDDCMLCEHELTHVERERTIGLLHEAIDSFDKSRKTAYLEARSRGIIDSESDPILFLRRTNFDPWQAAARLLEYWEQRVQIFGRNRAFRRLFDLSGDGCLNDEDIEVLQSGFHCELPLDEYGHSVIMYDRRRIPEEYRKTRRDSQIRAMVYGYVRAALNPLSQTEGVVFLALINMKLADPVPLRTSTRFLINCAPIKSHRVHIMYTVQSQLVPFLAIPPDLQRIFDYVYKGVSLPNSRRFHFGRGPEDFSLQLQSYGLSIDCVPQSLGGTWNYSNFDCRMEMQKCVSFGAKSNPQTLPVVADGFQSLSWSQLVKVIIGNLEQERKDSLIWEIQLARLKRALFGSRAKLTVNTTGCTYRKKELWMSD
jgi:hypothetical protein